MKKTIYLTALLILFGAISARAQDPASQDGQPQMVQPQSGMLRGAVAGSEKALAWQRGHRDYFPGTDVDARPDGTLPSARSSDPPHRKAGIASIGDSLNQCNVDYGNRLDAWRRQVVALTIQNTFFWLIVLESGALLLLCCYAVFLDREKRQRHIIAADIVCQLYNAWAYSDRMARKVIAKHNYWVRQINEEYETAAREVRGELPSGPTPTFDDAPVHSSIGSPEVKTLDEESTSYPIIPADVMVSGPRSVQEEDGILADPLTKGASIPTLDSARYQITAGVSPLETVSPVAVDDALARVNRNAAATAADSEWQREKKRLEEKYRASEEQNRALRKILNARNEEEAIQQENPFEQEGRP